MFAKKMLKGFLITLSMKFNWNRFVRSRDIDVLLKTGSRIIKLEVVKKKQKLYIFGFRRSCLIITKSLYYFEIEAKLRNFAKKKKMQILVNHFEYWTSWAFLRKLYNKDSSRIEAFIKATMADKFLKKPRF